MEPALINHLKETVALLRRQADGIEKMIVRLSNLPPPRTEKEYFDEETAPFFPKSSKELVDLPQPA